MSKAKFVAFSLIAAALLSWQIAGVNNATSGASGIVDPCSSLAWMEGPTPVCLYNCPIDDGLQFGADLGVTIWIVARDGSGAGIGGLPNQDIWLEGCSGTVVLCGGSGSVDADTATSTNPTYLGYTSMSGLTDWSASGCDLTGVVVVIQGVVVSDATCTPICFDWDVTSPDGTGDGGIVDGWVELADFSRYGELHNVPALYDACWDFNCDGYVELLDFSIFGQHYNHNCAGP
jgi:hypothetical protein